MISLTVKTLDSQNHHFSVDDDITVQEFKVKIADTVNISAGTQRIIYCGRVLQDNAKLKDYDVDGKVVHLVQRPPPSDIPPRTPTPPSQRRTRTFETGNTMYLGSMAFPSNLMESQGIVPPPPTHSLAGSRLNIAKRMLRRAEAVLNTLENPNARASEPAANADPPEEEEVMPIIEARVIVPPGNSDQDNESVILSAVQNSLLEAEEGATSTGTATPSTGESVTPPNVDVGLDEAAASASTSTDETAAAPETAPGSSTQTSAPNGRPLADNASRTSEMAELLATLNRLQARFAPFLERYRTFMADDPTVAEADVSATQSTLNRVSEVFHLLGHAYHSLSDIIIRVQTPAPRPLLCRPILIQHSAVVQAGIPIQVEAQINVSTERPPTSGTTTNTTTSTSTEQEQNQAGNGGSGTATVNQPTVSIRSIPLMPSVASMRLQSFPMRPSFISLPAQQRPSAPATATSTTATSTNNNNNNHPPSDSLPAGAFNVGNSSVEFFMEVTPEVLSQMGGGGGAGTATAGAANAANATGAQNLGGGINVGAAPPPEFLQSLLQMAGQIMNRVTSTDGGEATPTQQSAANNNASTAPPTQGQQQSTNQNTQAHVDSRTNPTRATHTRSTPRPHVHLAQQAMQSGFDPFLPCNSHHVTHRRRRQQQQRTEEQRLEDLRDQRRELMNAVHEALRRTIEDVDPQRGRRPQPEEGTTATPAQSRTDTATAAPATPTPAAPSTLPFPQAANVVPPLIASNLLNFMSAFAAPPPSTSTTRPQQPEEQSGGLRGVINELVALLAHSLTMGDVRSLSTGDFGPLQRLAEQFQALVFRRVLDDGATDSTAVSHAVDRLMTELTPFIERLSAIIPQPDIDVVRSVENLLRVELLAVVGAVATSTVDNVRDRCLSLVQKLCTLLRRIARDGVQGVEEAFRRIVVLHGLDVPNSFINSLSEILSSLCVNETEIERYIAVKQSGASAAAATAAPSNSRAEPMDLDNSTGSEVTRMVDDGDAGSLPAIVMGSETWHNQVPDDWVPIIARDVQRQRRHNPQPPFSDAYLAGMPSKRRKIVNGTKPQGSLPQVIAESVRRAVTATGLSGAANVEVVAQAAAESQDVQTAYRSLLRGTVQASLLDNEDFTADKYPNASSYFKPQ